jgi:hypothetical protein
MVPFELEVKIVSQPLWILHALLESKEKKEAIMLPGVMDLEHQRVIR